MSLYKIVSLILFSLLVTSCSEQKKADSQDKVVRKPYSGPSLESEDLQVVYTDSAKLSMTMDTKLQIILHNEDQEYPHGLFVTFFDENEKINSTIKANYGYYFKDVDKWKLKGKVVVNNPEKGQKLETEEMYWMPASHDILVEKKDSVTITEPDQILSGTGLTAKDDFSHYKITNPIGFRWVE